MTGKIIDLGLAKSLDEPTAQTAISTPGAFAGAPEFASPEQFAGVPVDIRSDLYSLGVTLWEMVTGKTPFRGAPGEVMSQHQRAPLPLELLGASELRCSSKASRCRNRGLSTRLIERLGQPEVDDFRGHSASLL